ncbi:MAG: hypothetical protein HY901_25095, partial [Deltaproteobacteria bacterium]|nr:hypothetical protein [Deltaproteobacteria bacterium]
TSEDASAIDIGSDRSTGSVKNVTFQGTKKGLRNCGKVTVANLKADKGIKAEEKCE